MCMCFFDLHRWNGETRSDADWIPHISRLRVLHWTGTPAYTVQRNREFRPSIRIHHCPCEFCELPHAGVASSLTWHMQVVTRLRLLDDFFRFNWPTLEDFFELPCQGHLFGCCHDQKLPVVPDLCSSTSSSCLQSTVKDASIPDDPKHPWWTSFGKLVSYLPIYIWYIYMFNIYIYISLCNVV